MDELLKRYLSLERDPFREEEWGTTSLWRFDRAARGTRVYFTTRIGGVSERPYKSLNLGFHVGDQPGRVRRNRQLLGGIFGFAPERLTSPRQRHSSIVKVINEKDVGAGADGSESSSSPFDPCDGLVTGVKQAPLLLLFADCVPVVVTARTAAGVSLVAVLHAGRRGLMAGVIGNGVRRLKKQAEQQGGVADTAVAIGPAIGPCCYQVGSEIADEFLARFGQDTVAGDHLDLREAARLELAGAGVDRKDIYTLDRCTCCNEHGFYSYRRDGGTTGRQGALAWIE